MKNTFKNHLSNERKEKLIDAWQYLKPWQKVSLFARAWWWSLPTIFDVIEHIQNSFNIWLTRHLYKAHWM